MKREIVHGMTDLSSFKQNNRFKCFPRIACCPSTIFLSLPSRDLNRFLALLEGAQALALFCLSFQPSSITCASLCCESGHHMHRCSLRSHQFPSPLTHSSALLYPCRCSWEIPEEWIAAWRTVLSNVVLRSKLKTGM